MENDRDCSDHLNEMLSKLHTVSSIVRCIRCDVYLNAVCDISLLSIYWHTSRRVSKSNLIQMVSCLCLQAF